MDLLSRNYSFGRYLLHSNSYLGQGTLNTVTMSNSKGLDKEPLCKDCLYI